MPSTDFWETPLGPLPEPQMKEGLRGPLSDQASAGWQGDSVTKRRGVPVSPGSLPVPPEVLFVYEDVLMKCIGSF